MARRFKVRMTFEGFQEGDTSHEAISKFKTQLGLAPESMRSEIHMTGLETSVVDDDCQGLPPDKEYAEAHPGPVAHEGHSER